MFVDAATFRRLVRARELLESPEHEAAAVRDIAARVGLSPFHFIRVFAALFGDTPHQLRTRARIDRARALLAGGATVTTACVEVGFSSVGSFSLLFHRRIGASPSSYRRRLVASAPIAPAAPKIPGCLGLITQIPAGAWSNSREARPG
jgi:AraC-like DNA-binding protein